MILSCLQYDVSLETCDCRVEPTMRMRAEEGLSHDWIRNDADVLAQSERIMYPGGRFKRSQDSQPDEMNGRLKKRAFKLTIQGSKMEDECSHAQPKRVK